MTTTIIDRRLHLDGIHNIRDLGGLPRLSGGETRFHRVMRGCGMDGLTDKGRHDLRGLGLARVIDLRSPGEISDNPGPFQDHDARYEVSLFGGLAPLRCMLEAGLIDLADRYIDALQSAPAEFAEVFRLLADTAGQGPVLFHCTAGKDRTGLIAALLLSLHDVPDEDIAGDYAATTTMGSALIARLRDRLGESDGLTERMLSADAASMQRVLSWIQASHGSAEAYLSGAGLSGGHLERLKTLL